MNTIFNNNNYFIMTLATITSIILLSTIMINPISGYDLSDVKSSIGYEEAIDEFDLPVNTKNFSMELDNGLVANYYLAPNQIFVFDGMSGAITEQNDNDNDNDNDDGDGKKKIKYYVDVTVTTTYSYPQSKDKPQDPRNDPKYDSIDWQDDDPEKNLSIEEMDEILEEREQEEQNSVNDNEGSTDGTDSSSNGQDDSGGDDSGGDDSGGDE
ncbi:MAG TPA: hypothetical protein VD815_04765 [Candidatus Saccharimonadales bacterium]|nr:hypothetical protein [Candidatus Saccharimonadales bacterium]